MESLDNRLREALAAAPELPDLYPQIDRKIRAAIAASMLRRATAALLVLAAGSIFVFTGMHRIPAATAEAAAAELDRIAVYYSGSTVAEEITQYSLISDVFSDR